MRATKTAASRRAARSSLIAARLYPSRPMKLDGIHHITAITGDAPRQRRLLHASARAAARGQDGQPGRARRLPPVLRRRDRHARLRADLLRVPGRDPGAAGRGHGAPHRLARGLAPRRSTSGRSGWATSTSPRSAPRAACASPTPRAWRTSSSSTTVDEPLVAEHPDIPRATRSAASRACARTAAGPSAPRLCSSACSARRRQATRRGSCAASAAAARSPTTRRPGSAARARAACTTWPGARRWPSTRSGWSAWRRPAWPDADHRPLLLPLDLLPRAVRRPVRDRRRRARLHRRRAGEELGTKIILPPFLESRRAEIEARLTPLPDPRARSAS